MKQQFWHNCWEKTSIGFHQEDVQPMLVDHFPDLLEGNDSRVFVPCCGKSSDLLFFSNRFKVIGNELSAIATRDFFKDNHLLPNVKESQPFTIYQQGNIEIYQGDFFSLNPNNFQPFDWIYDRAALIAFPPEMQAEYIAHLRGFFSFNTRLFLLSLEYPQTEMQGPPFSTNSNTIEQLFSGFKVERKSSRNLTGKKFAQRLFNVSNLTETLYIISKN